MFISILMLIPWISFGFKNSNERFIGLNQTKKSVTILLIIEVAFFLILIGLLGDKNPDVAGSGSFAWVYSMIYEKGIFPIFGLAELIDPTGGEFVDRSFPIAYLLTALIMDYAVLLLISPKVMRKLKTASNKN